ncbi:peptidyl-prolyl cis-trans isomerase [Evansella sp. AB-P1]|uniref:peptidyl-prolyl cis-trans isomerase n=1 Tax=Evansella sp. AB-P1 TaxID=3037653 RepID=UPI002420202F|nr:peptidyl-prolyl cis-trans isomerase [Evansella sp. AB-P1]MDG5789463.1 peptidyl-prolyl cis-trans isomerase [Evansella sp. AB-P1]
MNNLTFTISGEVNHKLTIDPGVWIFDERKVDLSSYFSQEYKDHNEIELEKLAKAWNQQRLEGALPTSNGNNVKMSRKELTEKSYGMPLGPFIENTRPKEQAKKVIFLRESGEEFQCSFEEAMKGILGFSNQGKPLSEDGPVHFYLGNGENKEDPVTNITGIIIK